ncbi:MAG: hypothetical protein Tsb0021_08430 [Chlamydiales bacterium]
MTTVNVSLPSMDQNPAGKFFNDMKDFVFSAKLPKTAEGTIDPERLQQAQRFIDENNLVILCAIGVMGTFFLSPRTFIISAITGTYLKLRHYEFFKRFDNDMPGQIISIQEAALAMIGMVGRLFAGSSGGIWSVFWVVLAGGAFGSIFADKILSYQAKPKEEKPVEKTAESQ